MRTSSTTFQITFDSDQFYWNLWLFSLRDRTLRKHYFLPPLRLNTPENQVAGQFCGQKSRGQYPSFVSSCVPIIIMSYTPARRQFRWFAVQLSLCFVGHLFYFHAVCLRAWCSLLGRGLRACCHALILFGTWRRFRNWAEPAGERKTNKQRHKRMSKDWGALNYNIRLEGTVCWDNLGVTKVTTKDNEQGNALSSIKPYHLNADACDKHMMGGIFEPLVLPFMYSKQNKYISSPLNVCILIVFKSMKWPNLQPPTITGWTESTLFLRYKVWLQWRRQKSSYVYTSDVWNNIRLILALEGSANIEPL